MVIAPLRSKGWLVAELLVAVAVLAIAMIPLAFSFRGEQKLVRAHYQKVIAMEIIDGEMEVLRAGEWRAYMEGEQEYRVTAAAATNLAAGKFLLTRSNRHLRLEWRSLKPGRGGSVTRQLLIPSQ